jgi:hypothetical protein
MELNEARHCVQDVGRIDITAEKKDCLTGICNKELASAFSLERCVWVPPADLMHELPKNFTMALLCATDVEHGVRRFYPLDSFEAFITKASVAGLALLDMFKGLGPEGRKSYRVMFQFFQRVRRRRERRRNRLLDETSLRVRRSGRRGAAEHSILPESVGLDAQGRGKSWTVGELIREGREEARACGVSSPTEGDCVHYGLVRAARRYPLPIGEDDVPSLIRRSLYDTILPNEDLEWRSNGPAGHNLRDLILERSLAALERHWGNESAEFNDWFSGPHNSFERQIFQRKRAPGGKLDRELVRRVLQDLGWDAYAYVSGCIIAFMDIFSDLISPPLTEPEKQRFHRMHLRQPYFGNFPFVLVAERFPYLNSILFGIWENGADHENLAVLYRLLAYYPEMAANRRATDRLRNERKKPGGKGYTLECSVNPESFEKTAGREQGREQGRVAQERVAEIAERVRLDRGFRCTCRQPAWDDRLVKLDYKGAVLSHFCDNCRFAATTTVTIEEMRRLAGELNES